MTSSATGSVLKEPPCPPTTRSTSPCLPAMASARGDGAGARGLAQDRGDLGSEVSLHRCAGRRQPLSRDRQVDAGQHGPAVRRGRRDPARRLRTAVGALSDNTEIMPQVELRFHFDLYAGVRPARLIPGVPSPIVGADQRGIDLIVIRESTEGCLPRWGRASSPIPRRARRW